MFYRFYAYSQKIYICYYLVTSNNQLLEEEIKQIKIILNLNLNEHEYQKVKLLHESLVFTEIGSKLEFTSPWGSNALSILHRCGFSQISRIEYSTLYPETSLYQLDKMVQQIYQKPLTSFQPDNQIKPSMTVELDKLAEFSQQESLGFDEFDLTLYSQLWRDVAPRSRRRSIPLTNQKTIFTLYDDDKKGSIDLLSLAKARARSSPSPLVPTRTKPSDVELFDLSQSNSEHSRHWLFCGKLKIDGVVLPHTLFDLIKAPIKANPENSLVAMKDNSSAIRGYQSNYLRSSRQQYQLRQKLIHPIFTAETHNFPTGIAPFPGAATGTGGRIRDIQAFGRGGLMMAGTVGYCVGNLDLDDRLDFDYPINRPVKILIEASNGASDYGNKIGEPMIQGFCRDYGVKLPTYGGSVNRIEWVKPIMFSGGIGQAFDEHVEKLAPESGMLIVRLGGPAYRIGVGGGAASSRSQKQDNSTNDFNAVQRDDAEMENRLNRVIRACIELELDNPILSIHDQGAGGMANVTKEIVSPLGGQISLGQVISGDATLSAKEKWIAEYQEQNTVLIYPHKANLLKNICLRENLPIQFVGFVSDTGRIQVYDPNPVIKDQVNYFPVDLDLDAVLENVPQKTFVLTSSKTNQVLPTIGSDFLRLTNTYTVLPKVIDKFIGEIFQLTSVGSKRFLTNKVDRSVTGLVAQQQCVGPLHTPLSNVAVIAQGAFGLSGIATSIGEQPMKGLISPDRMAKMAVGEMLTNLIWAPVSRFVDIKCSGNWMWEKKHPEEILALYQAVKSLSTTMLELGLAIDGGKDSLSMSAHVENEDVLAPRTLVMSAYVTCPDISKIVTPDLKRAGNSIIYLDLGYHQTRIGGSVLAQIHDTIGNESPTFDNIQCFKPIFQLLQELIQQKQIYAGHDRSDGGLITTLIEMAIAGNRGLDLNLDVLKFIRDPDHLIAGLFAEELGLVIEVAPWKKRDIIRKLIKLVPVYDLGQVKIKPEIKIKWKNTMIVDHHVSYLRQLWEKTSYRLDAIQSDSICAKQEYQYLIDHPIDPVYNLPDKVKTLIQIPSYDVLNNTYHVAIIREEGSNGDREMASAFHLAGFQTYDVTTNDLLNQTIDLDRMQGIVFVGGFSFADVLGAGRGWKLSLLSNPIITDALNRFYHREDTFSLGVCNGCQLMSELGWVSGSFEKNISGRFESRFSTVRISSDSNAIMLKDLGELVLGIWIAHGEGCYVPSEQFEEETAPLRYCHPTTSQPTEQYPHNPNGSYHGVAGLSSSNGRHLAMMPHPERCIYNWQTPWMPYDLKTDLEHLSDNKHFPWFELFRNAYRWCETISKKKVGRSK